MAERSTTFSAQRMTAPLGFVALTAMLTVSLISAAGAREPAPQSAPARPLSPAKPSIDAPRPPADRDTNACMTQVFRPGATERGERSVEIEPATTTPVAFPPVTRWVEREIIIRPQEVRYETTAAVFETRTVEEVVEPARTEYRVVEAVFEFVEEEIEVRAAVSLWRPGPGPEARRNAETGKLEHRVDIPAETATILRRVMIEPPRIEEIARPVVTRTIQVEVLVTPAQVREIVVPAEVKTIRVLETVRPARIERRQFPARMATIAQLSAPRPGDVEWRSALCVTDLPAAVVRDIQRALRRLGYDAGPVDGRVGPATRAALAAFQGVEPLSDQIFLTETLEELGVDINAALAVKPEQG